MTSRQRRRALGVLVTAVSSMGCGAGAAERVDDELPPKLETKAVGVVNSCPEFGWWLLSPKSLPLGGTAEIVVNVSDPDSPSTPLKLTWVASSGEFSDPARSETGYTCRAVGKQELALEARDDSDCMSTLLLDVSCHEPGR